MPLPEKLTYVHAALSAAFAIALIRHYLGGEKDPSVKSRLLITILIMMSVAALAAGIFWPDYHS
ncbi:TPA: hypothetical protein ACF3LB_000452 [Enterobacter hormaechei]|nr:hypothetical protein [Enterobacter hormaechei]MDU4265807.1 hypothetical protein [Enterobacter hormaechei]MDU4341294.1 hypothetical protein [Enterobacter hormaechei]